MGYVAHYRIFTDSQEKSLSKYQMRCAVNYFGLSPKEVRKLSYDLAVKYNSKRPITWDENEIAGEDWFTAFVDADYHIVSKYSSRPIKRAQTRWVASFNYGVPMATFQLHHQTLLPYSIKVLVKRNQTSPNSMGLRRLITEFLWPPSSSIIRPCYHQNIHRQDESNEPKLDGVASFNYGVPMATF
ncbi:hypothetical protein EVAR_69181_1 [Eumeta japonica]|uniref:Uncharacterized protein n=1 Tax=Eumeta variegata TaxID=151549 RepID=A0A4C1ZGH0_EUMVA|nr:hypothetical protein EVAR_69181_1 [Eumeta japonica]